MYNSNKRFRLAELKREHVDEASVLLGKMFLKYNNIWKTLGPTEDEVINFMAAKTHEMLDQQDELREKGLIDKETFLNFIYLDKDDRIVGAWNTFDLYYYLKSKSEVNLHHFNAIEKYGKELEKTILEADKVPKFTIYSLFTVIAEEFMGNGMIYLFTYDVFNYLHSRGYEAFYGRASNIKSFAIIHKLGALKTSEVAMTELGDDLKLYFIRFEIKDHHKMREGLEKIVAKLEA